MTDRSKEYHSCPEGPVPYDSSTANNDILMLRLDCYGAGGGGGILKVHFEHLFVQCIYCDLFMTRWAAYKHGCEAMNII
jgi:hypothetical protein